MKKKLKGKWKWTWKWKKNHFFFVGLFDYIIFIKCMSFRITQGTT